MKLGPYRTWLFDCDGVLLDSNAIKTEGFARLAAPFGAEVADALVQYHLANGGVSRFEKIRFLFEWLLGVPADSAKVNALARTYGAFVRDQLLACAETIGLRDFLQHRPANCRWYVVSGADEVELRDILAQRGLAASFDDIFGSPRTKLAIARELAADGPAIMFGDSRYDYEVATQLGIDFVFVSGCTEFAEWRDYFRERYVPVVTTLAEVQPT